MLAMNDNDAPEHSDLVHKILLKKQEIRTHETKAQLARVDLKFLEQELEGKQFYFTFSMLCSIEQLPWKLAVKTGRFWAFRDKCPVWIVEYLMFKRGSGNHWTRVGRYLYRLSGARFKFIERIHANIEAAPEPSISLKSLHEHLSLLPWVKWIENKRHASLDSLSEPNLKMLITLLQKSGGIYQVGNYCYSVDVKHVICWPTS